MRSLLGACLLLLAVPASAAERDAKAEAAAQEANRVRDELCGDGALANTTAAAKSLAEVTAVWATVSEELDRSRKVYLLYWRGVLGQCLSQEERAIDDLSRFVDSQQGRNLWKSLVNDAELRLKRLKAGETVEVRRAAPTNAGAVFGVIFAGGAGAAGGVAAWQWSEATATANVMYSEPHSGQTLLDLGAQGDQQQLISRILVGGSVGLGVAALTSLIVGGASAGGGGQRASLPPMVAVVPSPDGATLVLGGRW